MYGGINLGTWPIGPSDDTRDALDRRALYEAHLAADLRDIAPAVGRGLVARLRAVLADRPAPVDACVCPA